MAKQLTPLGRLIVVLCGLSLVGYGLYRYGVLDKIACDPGPRQEGRGHGLEGRLRRRRRGERRGHDPAAHGDSRASARPVAGGSRSTRPIKVAIVTWGGYAGGIVANNGFAPNKNCLFFKDFGLEVEIIVIDDFEKSRDAFRAGGDKGGVDIMWSTVDAFALEYGDLERLNPKTILQYDWSRGGDAIAVDGSIQRVADLKGKKIACAEATPSHYFALFVLTQGGLTNHDVQWVFTASAIEAANVFKAGQVDAAVSWSPDVYIAAKERPGARILASTREATNLIADIFVARGDFLEQHPEDARRFVAGWLKGVDLANRNPDKAATLLARASRASDLDAAKGMLEDVKLPTFAENRALLRRQGLAGQLPHDLQDGPGHLAQDRQDQERLRALPDARHALPRGRGRVLPRRRRAKPGQARVRVQGPAAAAAARPSSRRRSRSTSRRGIVDARRERQGGARHAGRRAGSDLRQRLPARRRQHRRRRAAATPTCRLSQARAEAVARYLDVARLRPQQVRGRRQRPGPSGRHRTTRTRAAPRTAARTSRSSRGGPRSRMKPRRLGIARSAARD